MKVVFWGTRGSLPAPLSAEDVQAKINAAVMRIREADIKSPDARQKFLSSLPQSIYGTVGGNTPCVQIVSKSGGNLILDAGSGIRGLAANTPIPESKRYTILLSHLHWDHIQGFPFFAPIFNPEVTLDIDLLKQPQKEDIEYSDDVNDLSKLGYGVISTKKSPFDAVAKMKSSDKHSPLMANVEKNRTEKTLKRMAIPLKDLSMVTTSEPVFIINNDKIKESLGTIPVIKSWELKEFENSKELLKMIKERKEN